MAGEFKRVLVKLSGEALSGEGKHILNGDMLEHVAKVLSRLAKDGTQVEKSNIAYWASDEFQSRFNPAGGAYVFIPRSLEEDMNYWGDNLIEPLRAAIDGFISANKNNIANT